MSSSITTKAVRNAMTAAGASQYTSYAGPLADHLNREGVSESSVRMFASARGAAYIGSGTVASFVAHLNQTPATEVTETAETEGFDRDRAASILREYAAEQGADMTEVEEVLIEAGLVDEPEVEEEPENIVVEADSIAAIVQKAVADAVAPLVQFARNHGYRG